MCSQLKCSITKNAHTRLSSSPTLCLFSFFAACVQKEASSSCSPPFTSSSVSRHLRATVERKREGEAHDSSKVSDALSRGYQIPRVDKSHDSLLLGD